jgi:signal transduction histidine kinase
MAKHYGVSPLSNLGNLSEAVQQYEARLEHQRNVLKHIIDVGTSLRLSMDTDTLLKRVCVAACEALRFHDAVLYLADGAGYFRACAAAHATAEEEEYLRQHSLPESVVARLISEDYRLSDSYFIPAEAPLWQEEMLTSFFVVDESVEIFSSIDPLASANSTYWLSEDLMIVPLVSGDNTLLGFLTPDGPLDGLRPTAETMSLFELFANQAAVVIEGERLSTELREALKQAQESERLKNHFLMTASHELRTPLTAIQGYLELLGEFGGMLDEETKGRFLGSARRACEELVLLLGNVMDASRIDQDRVTLAFGSVSVVQAVQLILEILEPIVVRETRIVEVRIADDLHVWVDELRFRQILLNLVGNALKYTPESSSIAISAESLSWDELHQRIPDISQQVPVPTAGNFAVIAIRDWGPGIRPEDQPRLFSKFVRLREAINSIQRGAGLGLYLCRQLAEAMNGHIWMESKGVNGAGCTFFVALPRCQ